MKPAAPPFRLLASVSDFTEHFGFPPPAHPLLTVVDLANHRHPPVTGPASTRRSRRFTICPRAASSS